MTMTITDIDALLAAPKTIFDAPQWVEDGNRARWRADLQQQNGALIGGLALSLTVTMHTNPQRGSGVLIFDGKPIQRISFLPDHAHSNPNSHPVSVRLRFRTLPPNRSRIYRWRDNRAWPTPQPMAGEQLDPQPNGFQNAVTVFLAECGISGAVLPAPWRPTLL